MPSSKRRTDEVRALCAHLHPDDGVDPREDKRRDDADNQRPDRKLKQLCKQVGNALQLAFSTLARAEALVDATVAVVVPAPDAGRLRVFVAVSDACDPEQVGTLLTRSSGHLRAEVAEVVSRRRVPELVFSIIVEGEDDV